jgi:hypothetical protein
MDGMRSCLDLHRKWRISRAADPRYFSPVATDVNVVLRELPRLVTATMIAIEIPAAMRPYSMAVAADSSRQKDANFDMKSSLTNDDGGMCLRPFLF